MKKLLGFSLLELVVVIVVISLIAIIAIPKYIEIVDEAKKSSVESMAGSYASAVISARAQWKVDRQPKMVDPDTVNLLHPVAYNQVSYDDTGIWLVDKSAAGLSGYRAGYPISVSEGGRGYTTSVNSQDCVLLMENLLQNPPVVVSVDQQYSKDDGVRYLAQAKSNTCTYFQQEGAHHSFTYEIQTGRVTVHLQQ